MAEGLNGLVMTRRADVKQSRPDRERRYLDIYHALYASFGPQGWWPGDSPFEMMVGAVLTQNTAWSNVEKAIANLSRAGLLSPVGIDAVSETALAEMIRPSGYFNIKARRLKNLARMILAKGGIEQWFSLQPERLREELLAVNGIGPETADSILLYAAGLPFFVVDAYTRRIFSRHAMLAQDDEYHDIQRRFMSALPADVQMFNEYHALIVRTAKEYCRKSAFSCAECPLNAFL